MKIIYDRLLHGRKLQMHLENKGNIFDIIMNLTHGRNNYGQSKINTFFELEFHSRCPSPQICIKDATSGQNFIVSSEMPKEDM